jgi:hypothetical protein
VTPWTEADFDDDTWERLCKARKHNDITTWYRLLRERCGYTQGRWSLRVEIEELVDDWLARHPGWSGRWV